MGSLQIWVEFPSSHFVQTKNSAANNIKSFSATLVQNENLKDDQKVFVNVNMFKMILSILEGRVVLYFRSLLFFLHNERKEITYTTSRTDAKRKIAAWYDFVFVFFAESFWIESIWIWEMFGVMM